MSKQGCPVCPPDCQACQPDSAKACMAGSEPADCCTDLQKKEKVISPVYYAHRQTQSVAGVQALLRTLDPGRIAKLGQLVESSSVEPSTEQKKNASSIGLGPVDERGLLTDPSRFNSNRWFCLMVNDIITPRSLLPTIVRRFPPHTLDRLLQGFCLPDQEYMTAVLNRMAAEGVRMLIPLSFSTDVFLGEWCVLPQLESKPWWVGSEQPWTTAFLPSLNAIRSEAIRAFGAVGEDYNEYSQVTGGMARDGTWSVAWLMKSGRPVLSTRSLCPVTWGLVDRVPRILGDVWFASLLPHSSIRAHAGATNLIVKYQLPLVVPPRDGDCYLRVGGEKRSYREGEWIGFDDSYLHEVVNNSDTPRLVLIIELWHPSLTEDEVKALSLVGKCKWEMVRRALRKKEEDRAITPADMDAQRESLVETMDASAGV